jgi:RNA polymerase sigma-32 factor
MKSLRSEDLTSSEAESKAPEGRGPYRIYLDEASKHPLMTKEEEREMAERVRTNGNREAGQRMVLANLRLVVKIALNYRSHINLLDLIQEGNIGLVRAVGKYDPERGTRFSTYASFWIRAYMLRYLMDTWSIVKMGEGRRRGLLCHMNREKEEFGRADSSKLLADNLEANGVETEDTEDSSYCHDVSLEAPQQGGGYPLVDTMGSGEDIEERVIEKDHTEMFYRKLDVFRTRLNERESFILDNRIMAEDPLTLREIGERFHMSREGVRRIQARISRNLVRNFGSNEIQLSM